MVYLHGAIGQKGWAPFMDRLARNFTVYAPYLPGYGDSTGLEHLDDVTDLTLYQFELLDALGLDRVNLAGHFLGGMIAAEMAAMAPPFIDRLVLAAPAGLWNDAVPVADLMVPVAGGAAGIPVVVSVRPRRRSGGQLEFAGTFGRRPDAGPLGHRKFTWPIPDRGLKRRAYRIKAPTLILWGANDRINPPSYASDFQRLISGSRITTLPGAGHLAMLEQAEAFADAVGSFLAAN